MGRVWDPEELCSGSAMAERLPAAPDGTLALRFEQ